MTISFSSFFTALAISASLVAVTTPVSANEATRDTRSLSGAGGTEISASSGVISRAPIANGDLGSGRGGDGVTGGGPISSGDQGSGRVSDFAGQTSGSGR